MIPLEVHALDWAFLLVALIAIFVSSLSFFYWIKLYNKKGEYSWLILGIALTWLSEALSTIWIMIWRAVGYPTWMHEHWSILIFLAILFVGAVLHVRIFTVKINKGLWKIMALIGGVSMLTYIIWATLI